MGILEDTGKVVGKAVADKRDVDLEHMNHTMTCEHCIRKGVERQQMKLNIKLVLDTLASVAGYKLVAVDSPEADAYFEDY